MEKIIRQGSWILTAQVLTKIISFFYTIFLARSLGVESFGLYSVALAYFSLISAAADFGFSRFLIRELSKDIKKASEIFCNLLLLRLSLASVLFALLSLVLFFADSDKLRVSLTLLAVMAVLPQAVASVLDGVFAALQKLRYSAIALFLSSVTTALFGFTLIQLSFGPIGALVALIIGQVFLVFILWLLLYRLKVVSLTSVTSEQIKKIIIGSFPYGLLGVLGMLYFRIDTVLLSYLRGSFETGLYSAAYKFLDAIMFIPGVLSVALFPVLTKLHDSNLADVKKLYFKSLKFMVMLGVIILLGYAIALPFIIKILLPNYIQAINVVLILSLSIPFIFAQACAVQVLFSTNKYLKQVIFLSLLSVLFNIFANLIFIPKYGLYAASWITVVSEVLSFIIFLQFIRTKVLR